MIHRLSSLSITDKLYESMQPGVEDLRFAAIESNLARYTTKSTAWHWHEAVEFAVVTDGALDCLTPRQNLALPAGDGYFVNTGVLHMNRMASGSQAATLHILQFDPEILAGAGVIARRYLQPILTAGCFECLRFSREAPAHRAVLDGISALYKTAEEEGAGYELRIVGQLFDLWYRFCALASDSLGNGVSVPDGVSARIKAMLTLIHSCYQEPLSVADIAAAASLSEREAYRTFRQVLNITPAAYLLQHRVRMASRLLTETDSSVTEIGLACGFGSPNYFAMAFKTVHGISPREFRRKNRFPPA